MVAALYDQSLDAYLPHDWMSGFGVFRQDSSNLNSNFENSLLNLQHIRGNWPVPSKDVQLTYRAFPADLTVNLWGYAFLRKGAMRGLAMGGMARTRSDANGRGRDADGRTDDGRQRDDGGSDRSCDGRERPSRRRGT